MAKALTDAVICQYLQHGWSYRRIAERHGLSKSSIAQRVARCRKEQGPMWGVPIQDLTPKQTSEVFGQIPAPRAEAPKPPPTTDELGRVVRNLPKGDVSMIELHRVARLRIASILARGDDDDALKAVSVLSRLDPPEPPSRPKVSYEDDEALAAAVRAQVERLTRNR